MPLIYHNEKEVPPKIGLDVVKTYSLNVVKTYGTLENVRKSSEMFQILFGLVLVFISFYIYDETHLCLPL